MSANIGKNVVFLAFIRQKYPNTGGGDTFAGIFKLHKRDYEEKSVNMIFYDKNGR